MHKIIVIISLLASCMFIGCQDGETYASQLKKEQKLIADFISRNNIKVVKTMPTADEWKDEKLYYLSSSGLYFHLVDAGDTTGDSIQQNDLVFPRYIKYTLKANADTLWVWNTVDATYPGQFNYLDLSQACEAWHEAVLYMKYNNSQAKLIIHSQIGFKSDEDKGVTPYGYDLRIKFQK